MAASSHEQQLTRTATGDHGVDFPKPGRPIARKASDAQPVPSLDGAGADNSAIQSFGDAVNAGIHATPDTLIARAAESSGHAIPGELRGRFEASLGTDLAGVRVHTDSAAEAASNALGARAYATGQDVFMGAGQYNPSSADGALLLAHEVAHTVQQRGGSSAPQMKLEVSNPGDAMEHEADHAAAAMIVGAPATVGATAAVAARQPHHNPTLLPEQQHLVDQVMHGRGLAARGTEELLHLVRGLSGVWAAQPPHSPTRRTVAQALYRMFIIFDEHVAREFDANRDIEGAIERPEFQLVDEWSQDAGEASPRSHSRHRTRVRPPVPPAPPTHTDTPPDRISRNDVEHATSEPQVEVTRPPSELPHLGVTVAEGVAHALEIYEMISESFVAGCAGTALGALATVAATVLTINAGDELNERAGDVRAYITQFCTAFAHTVRGEPGGATEADRYGVRAGNSVRTNLALRYPDLSSLSQISMAHLYSIAWRALYPVVRRQLAEAAESVFHDRDHADTFARGMIDATATPPF